MKVFQERRLFLVFRFWIILAMSPSLLSGQTVRGVVTDTSGSPIDGAIVQFLDTRQHIVASDTLRVNTRGHFFLRAPYLRNNRVVYGIRACAPGMATQLVFAPFTQRDTLAVAISLAPGTALNPGSKSRDDCDRMPGVIPVRVMDTTSFAAKAVMADVEATSLTRAYWKLSGSGSTSDTTAANAYRHATAARLDTTLGLARGRTARERAAYELLRFAVITDEPLDERTRIRIRTALPPESSWWLSRRQLLQLMVTHLYAPADTAFKLAEHPAERQRVERYLNRMVEGLHEPEATSELKFSLVGLAFAARDTSRAETLLAELLQTQPDYWYSKIAQDIWDPNRPLRVGVQMPDFAFPELPDTTHRITNSVLAAKYTLTRRSEEVRSTRIPDR